MVMPWLLWMVMAQARVSGSWRRVAVPQPRKSLVNPVGRMTRVGPHRKRTQGSFWTEGLWDERMERSSRSSVSVHMAAMLASSLVRSWWSISNSCGFGAVTPAPADGGTRLDPCFIRSTSLVAQLVSTVSHVSRAVTLGNDGDVVCKFEGIGPSDKPLPPPF